MNMSDDIVSTNVIGNGVNEFILFHLIPSMILATSHVFQEVQKFSQKCMFTKEKMIAIIHGVCSIIGVKKGMDVMW